MASTERVVRALVFLLLLVFGLLFVGPRLTIVVAVAFLALVALDRWRSRRSR